MKYDITGIVESYPGVHIGVLYGEELDNVTPFPGLYRLQKEAITETQAQIGDQPATRHPHIASWREIYRSFGTKPSDYRPSAEALVRRTIKTGKLPVINTAVDLYNVVSVKHIIPMGGFDTDKVEGDIYLRVSDGGETFTPLGASKQEETYSGEVVYADDARILTRRWNFRDADETKITSETRNLVMFIDASPEIKLENVESALDELLHLLEDACGGKYAKAIASSHEPIISLR
ncbi:MAG: phenylalanine--tRNA ligase beta subunit-related protein [Candidatus Bathyarchaeia archaeon]